VSLARPERGPCFTVGAAHTTVTQCFAWPGSQLGNKARADAENSGGGHPPNQLARNPSI